MLKMQSCKMSQIWQIYVCKIWFGTFRNSVKNVLPWEQLWKITARGITIAWYLFIHPPKSDHRQYIFDNMGISWKTHNMQLRDWTSRHIFNCTPKLWPMLIFRATLEDHMILTTTTAIAGGEKWSTKQLFVPPPVGDSKARKLLLMTIHVILKN